MHFTQLRVDITVLSYIGRAEDSVASCLKLALKQIKEGQLRLLLFHFETELYFARACGHIIEVSIKGGEELAVVVGMKFSPESDIL